MNPIFSAFNTFNGFKGFNNSNYNNPMNNFSNFMNQFNQFKQSFQGDPKEQVQQLINSGAMSQEQFEKLTEMAKQFQGMMKG